MDDAQKRKVATFLKWGAGIGAAVAIAPFIFLAVQGIIGLALAVVVGSAIIHLAPWFSMKMANLRLFTIKHEARSNPIETLQNSLVEQRNQLLEFKNAILSFMTEVKNFKSKVDRFAADQPENAQMFKDQLAAMEKLLARREAAYRKADAELDRFEESIAKASALWDMAQAAAKMSRIAGKMGGGDFEKIKVETALDSVQSAVNKSFAELEHSLLDEDIHPPALENSPTGTPLVMEVTNQATAIRRM